MGLLIFEDLLTVKLVVEAYIEIICVYLCDCVNEGVQKAQLLASGVT